MNAYDSHYVYDAMEIMGDTLIETTGNSPIIIDYYEPELKDALR